MKYLFKLPVIGLLLAAATFEQHTNNKSWIYYQMGSFTILIYLVIAYAPLFNASYPLLSLSNGIKEYAISIFKLF